MNNAIGKLLFPLAVLLPPPYRTDCVLAFTLGGIRGVEKGKRGVARIAI